MDENKDGTLSLSELRKGLSKLQLFEMLVDTTQEDEDCYTHIMD